MDFCRGIQNFARILRSKLQIRENRQDPREVKGVSKQKRPSKRDPFSWKKYDSLDSPSLPQFQSWASRLQIRENGGKFVKAYCPNKSSSKTQSLAKYSDFIKTGPIYHAGFGACQRIQPGVSRGVFIELPWTTFWFPRRRGGAIFNPP